MLKMKRVLQTVCLLAVTACSIAVRAQETSGSISGTVTDASGAIVKGATVTLTNTDQGRDVRTVTTSGAGFYTATSLPLGTYSVKFAAPGFKTESMTGLVLHVSDALTVNEKLTVGSASELVTVQASEVQLNLENGMSQGLINGTQVRELVLNNRNYEQLLTLQPGVSYGGANDQLYVGVSLPAGTSNQVAFSVNGQRATANNWTIDGADNVDRGANLTLLSFPSVDAISEFKTLRGTYTAEFGRSASGQVNVVTRSGTNDFHGSAYEFFRNDVFNANAYFNKIAAVVQRPKLRYNDFGYTIGGPVRIPHLYNGKDKTFFFFSQEFRRVINYSTVTTLVPTAAERVGDFSNSYTTATGGTTAPVAVCVAFAQTTTTSTCTQYGTKVTNISPTAAAYLKDIYAKVPLPPSAADIAGGLDPHTYIYNQRNVFNDTQEFARIDQAIGQKMNVFYRYLHDSLPSTEAGGLFVGNGLPGVQTTNTSAPGTEHLGHLTYTITPTMLMDLGYAYSSGAVISVPVGLVSKANSPDINPNLPFTPSLGVIPSFTSTNLTGISSAGIYNDYNRNHNVFGDVTKTFGRHTFKAGATYNHYEKTENATGNGSPYPQGTFSFLPATAPTAAQITAAGATAAPTQLDSAFANFLLGNANGGFTQGSAALTPDIQENLFEVYLQDDWKIIPRLTLNLGVRYSYFGQPTDNNHMLSSFDPSKYVAGNAPTVASNGTLCRTGTCANVNGLNSGLPNANADALNGIILGTPGSYGHASQFGSQVGSVQKTNFAPRLGFALDVFGDGKTAFRGGYGIAFDDSAVSIYETAIFNNPPYVNVPSLPVATFDNPAGGTASVSTAIPSIYGSPINYKTPYTQQFSLDLQQALTSTWMLDIGFFGNLGTHLQGKVDLNTIRPGSFLTAGISATGACPQGFVTQSCEQQLNQIRPYRGYTAIADVMTIFSSNYSGLQVKTTKKFAGKSYLDANYTWSKALTNSQTDYSSSPQNLYNINGDYGRASYDRTNILTIDGVYELPFYKDQKGLIGRAIGGWELTGIFAANSGLPLTVSMSASATNVVNYGNGTAATTQVNVQNPGALNGGAVTDAAGLGILGPSPSGLRPDQVANPNNGYGSPIHTRLNWFYRPAFAAPSIASARVGNAKRGTINGPGYNKVDLGLFRNFKIVEGVVFQLRGEAFNVLNHTNFQAVGVAASTASTFGQVTSARDNRILQVGGKINF